MARALGLAGRVAPDERFEEVVESTFDAVRRIGPAARAAVKAEMSRRLPVPDATLFARSIHSAERVDGMTAFLEKRDPVWPRSRADDGRRSSLTPCVERRRCPN